jgi:hypothetical protein
MFFSYVKKRGGRAHSLSFFLVRFGCARWGGWGRVAFFFRRHKKSSTAPVSHFFTSRLLKPYAARAI